MFQKGVFCGFPTFQVAQLSRNRSTVFPAHAAQSKGGGQAVQSGSGGYVGCSCYASQASRR